MNKRILILLLAFILALSAALLTACGGKLDIAIEVGEHGRATTDVKRAEPGDEVTLTLTPDDGYCADKVLVNDVEQQIDGNKSVFVMPNANAIVSVTFAKIKYSVNIANMSGGAVTANGESFNEGENVKLTVAPAYGYELSSLTVDGTAVQAANNAYSFNMPSKNVDVSATFATTLQAKALPNGAIKTLSSNAPAGAVATANLFVNFGYENLVVTAYVTDRTVMDNKDGIALYFGTSDFSETNLSEKNIAVKALADKSFSVYQGGANGYTEVSKGYITVNTEAWSVQTGTVTGYIVEVTLPYDVLGVTKATAQSKLTMLPYLANSDRTGAAFGANENTFDDFYTYLNANTYPLVSQKGFADNEFMFGANELGTYKDVVTMGNQWHIENGVAKLTGHDNADNNIAFVRSSGNTAYVKATFKVTDLYNRSERFPKFGFMVYDTASANSGVFFYVDASAREDKTEDIGIDDLTGTTLGYVTQTNGEWRNWTEISGTNGAYNPIFKTITLSIIYKDGILSFYRHNLLGQAVLVGGSGYRAQGDIVIGIKSFALGLEVSDYTATNKADVVATYDKRADGHTIGDNASGYAYTEGWDIYPAMDMAENVSGAGDQMIYIKDVTASTDFFAQASVTSSSKIDGSRDEYTKVGMAIKNENYTIFGYVDLEDRTDGSQRILTNFAVRFESGPNIGQWRWEVGVPSRYGTTIEEKFVVLGIAKLGAKVYLTMNGKVVATYTNKEIEDQSFVAGVLGFNRKMTVKDGSGTMIVDEVKENLGLKTKENVVFDGVLNDAIWTKEVMDATQTFAENEKTGTKVEIAAVKGTDGVFVALTLYTKTMQRQFAQAVAWSDVANVEFRLNKMTESNKDNKNLVHYIAFYDYLDGAVGSSASFLNASSKVEKTTLANNQEGYKATVEFFIPYSSFTGSSSTDAELPFYVWTCTFDDTNMAAMNREYKEKTMVVTDHGIVVKDNA